MTPQEAIDFIECEVQIDVRFCSDEEVDKTIVYAAIRLSRRGGRYALSARTG